MSENEEAETEAPVAADANGADAENGTIFDLKEKLANFEAWDSLVFNDRLYSEDENHQRDGNYLIDVSLDKDGIIRGPRLRVEASAEGRINGLRWTLKLTANLAAATLDTLTQTLVEEVEAGHEEDAGMIVKTTTIEGVRGMTKEDDGNAEEGEGRGEEGEESESAEQEESAKEAPPTAEVQPLTSYKITKTTKHGDEETTEEKSLSDSEIVDFISEGANIILLRLLVKCDFCATSSSLQMKTIDPNLNLTPAIYTKLESKKESLGGVEVNVVGIERVIICPEDVKVTSNSFFLPSAHLAIRQQIGSPTIVKIESLPTVTPPPIPEEEEEVEEEKPAFEKKELNWEEDMMLFSKYLDRKEELKASHMTYIRHHPELKCLLADFLQQLLLRKPDDVLPFAESFFSSFSLTNSIPM